MHKRKLFVSGLPCSILNILDCVTIPIHQLCAILNTDSRQRDNNHPNNRVRSITLILDSMTINILIIVRDP